MGAREVVPRGELTGNERRDETAVWSCRTEKRVWALFPPCLRKVKAEESQGQRVGYLMEENVHVLGGLMAWEGRLYNLDISLQKTPRRAYLTSILLHAWPKVYIFQQVVSFSTLLHNRMTI